MKIDEHFKIAREFDAVLAKLDRQEDGLAVIEMLMMAGTNYMRTASSRKRAILPIVINRCRRTGTLSRSRSRSKSSWPI